MLRFVASMSWHPGEFQLHSIHTGRGESLFWILPDGTTLLLDAGDHAPRGMPEDERVALLPDASRRAGEWIARYVRRVNPAPDPAWVDYLVVSHLHSDHTGYAAPDGEPRGLADAARFLHFRKAIDRGYPDYADPCPCVDQDVAAFLRALYGTLQERDGLAVERFAIGAHDQIRPLHGDAAGFSTFNLCANGRVADEKTGRIENFYRDYPDCQPGFTGRPWINENGMSLGFLVRYGAFSLFLAGDFSDRPVMPEGVERFEIEDRMAAFVPPVSAAKVNHHGHYSMPAKLVAALRAKVWFGSVWTKNQFVPPVMERLADRSLYPGDRLVCPGVFPPVLEEARAAGAPCIADIPPAAADGGHVVITVPPGGETFTVQYLAAADESMRVAASYEFPSR